jgi:hypothetical protein
MKALHPPIPIDPHCLVALFFLSANGPVVQFHNAIGTLHDSMVVCSQDESFPDLLAAAVEQV